MADIEDLIEAARIIVLQPDDILVLEFEHALTLDQCERAKAIVSLRANREVLVISGARLRILQEAETT